MSEKPKTIVTRFAPSPTGFMHVGGVRTALYAWLFARKNGGKFILRIEDTDKEREVPGSIEHIIESLKWLNINWDEGVDIGGPNAPYIQSQRLDSYIRYANILIEKGLAYPDPYTEEEINNLRQKADENKEVFLFRNYRPETFEKWDMTKPLRFKVPEIKSYKWHDVVRGDLSAGDEALDDFILIKSDGYPTYNFAHIIDDLEMGVTHIMRADEFIASTPKFLSLYEALDIVPPELVTLPPIMREDGTKKLGKRDGAKDIMEYKRDGYLPEAILNFLALLGWNPKTEKEIFTLEELVATFSLENIHSSGAKLNEEKLNWINKEHIKLQSTENQFLSIKKYLNEYDDELIHKLQGIVIERISNYGEIGHLKETELAFFIKRPEIIGEKLLWKDSGKDDAIKNLTEVRSVMFSSMFSNLEEVKLLLMPIAEKNGKGNVLWPLRYALSGLDKSIDPFSICSILDKEEILLRIDKSIEILNKMKNNKNES